MTSQDLDAVRATKATKMVQGHVDRLQETLHLAQVGLLEMFFFLGGLGRELGNV